MVNYTGTQQSKPYLGVLTLAAGEKKCLTDATWYGTDGAAVPPAGMRGFSALVTNGSIRIGCEAAIDADVGALRGPNGGVGDSGANGVALWFAKEAAGAAATIVIEGVAGGAS